MVAESVMFTLLWAAVCGETLDSIAKGVCTPQMLENVYMLSAKHDIAHLAGYALEQLEFLNWSILAKYKSSKIQAIYRYMKQSFEVERIYNVLDRLNIPYIPLKGIALRQYYPEPWMRTCSDIDVLVKEEMIDSVVNVLIGNLGYKKGVKSDHDVSLYSTNGVHLELHYDTIQDNYNIGKSKSILGQIWQYAEPIEEGSFQYRLSDEMFYFYHIAHMAKHFENGGCGIRPFIDLWLLDNIADVNIEKRNELLQRGGLLQFANAARNLSRAWFDDRPMDLITERMQEYVINGGAYGTSENRVSLQQQKNGGTVKYVISKLFIPFEEIKYYYPILQKYKWLAPIMHIHRWINTLMNGHAKKIISGLKKAKSQQKKEYSMDSFLQDIGLR